MIVSPLLTEDVVIVAWAWPLTMESETVPKLVLPSMNWTEPLGDVLPEAAVTVAVNVTGEPVEAAGVVLVRLSVVPTALAEVDW